MIEPYRDVAVRGTLHLLVNLEETKNHEKAVKNDTIDPKNLTAANQRSLQETSHQGNLDQRTKKHASHDQERRKDMNVTVQNIGATQLNDLSVGIHPIATITGADQVIDPPVNLQRDTPPPIVTAHLIGIVTAPLIDIVAAHETNIPHQPHLQLPKMVMVNSNCCPAPTRPRAD